MSNEARVLANGGISSSSSSVSSSLLSLAFFWWALAVISATLYSKDLGTRTSRGTNSPLVQQCPGCCHCSFHILIITIVNARRCVNRVSSSKYTVLTAELYCRCFRAPSQCSNVVHCVNYCGLPKNGALLHLHQKSLHDVPLVQVFDTHDNSSILGLQLACGVRWRKLHTNISQRFCTFWLSWAIIEEEQHFPTDTPSANRGKWGTSRTCCADSDMGATWGSLNGGNFWTSRRSMAWACPNHLCCSRTAL